MRVDLDKLLIIIKPKADLYSVINNLLYINYTKFDSLTIIIEKEISDNLTEKLVNFFYFFNTKFLNITKITIYTNNKRLAQEISLKNYFINKSYNKTLIINEIQDIDYNNYDKIITFDPYMILYNKKEYIKDE